MTLDPVLHERLFRGQEALDRLGAARVSVCGAGALGSLLVDTLAREGFRKLTAIDFDRVEPRNVSTQLYSLSDAGALKVQVLRSLVFRATNAEVVAVSTRLHDRNADALLRDAQLIVDAFDNSSSRKAVADFARRASVPCLHVGLNGGYGEVRWDDVYVIPRDAAGPDMCEYPLARNIVQLTVAIASESLVRFVLTGEKESYTVTLGDLRISRWPGT